MFSVLIMLVGWCTPTEAAALGAVSVIVLAACYGEMTWKAFVKSLDGALRVTVMAFLVIFGSATFAQVLAFTGGSSGLISWATGFQVTPLRMLYIMIGVIIFLGSFMDPLSKMLLTAPIFFPLAKTLGFDLTWFGLIMLLALEMGYTMPPFGLLLFVMKGVSPPGTRMRDIYLAGLPFIACVVLLILLVDLYSATRNLAAESESLIAKQRWNETRASELAGKVALVTGGRTQHRPRHLRARSRRAARR